jgi:hypothetical protein
MFSDNCDKVMTSGLMCDLAYGHQDDHEDKFGLMDPNPARVTHGD